ncbi:MAG: hypothetical protein AAF805_03375 [Planctomycetota bacterium]
MANTMRWRYGDTNPVTLPVDAATEVEIGDLLTLVAGVAEPVSETADQGSILLNQSTFHDNFVGVAMQASPAGEASTVRIATTGVFEFEAAPSAYELGTELTAAAQATGNLLQDQRLAEAVGVSSAIGRCAKRTGAGTSRVLVDIVSTVMRGGPQARE